MVEPLEARRALAEVRDRKRQVIDRAIIPGWHWIAVGTLSVVFSAGVESRRPPLIVISSVVFAVGLAVTVALVVARTPVNVHRDLLGAPGALTIAGFVTVLVGLSLGVGFALQAAGVAYPGTWATVFSAVGLIAGGPLLMRRLRAIMRARADR